MAKLTEQLEKEAQRCFEAEELAARYKDELEALKSQRSDEMLERLGHLEEAVRAKDTEIGSLKVKECAGHANWSFARLFVSLSFIYSDTY